MAKTRKIDTTKGYRIHFNVRAHSEVLPTFSQSFVGTPAQSSQWYHNDPDLIDRESRVVSSLDQILNLMQTADHARLADSKVIFGTDFLPWKEFFIRADRSEKMQRFADLYNRVGKIKGGDLILCAMLFEASETKTIGQFRGYQKGDKKGSVKDVGIKGQALGLEDGTNVDFELHFDYMKDNARQTFTIQKGQLILATGLAGRASTGRNRETVRVHVDNERASRWLTREELTTPPPPQEPAPPMELTYEMLGKLD